MQNKINVGVCLLCVWSAALPCTVGTARAQTESAAVALPVSLRPAFATGQSATYEFWSNREQSRKVAFNDQQRKVETTMLTEGAVRWVIDRVRPDGSASATMTLLWMTAQITGPDGKPQMNDSRKPGGDVEPVYKLLVAMTNKPVRVSVQADGSIDKAEGLEAMRTAIGPDLAELVPDETDFMETASDLATLPFAPAQAEPGTKWTAQYKWNHETGHTDQSWSYTLASIDTLEGVPIATIDGKGKLTLTPDFSEVPPNAPKPSARLVEADATSQVLFDLSRQQAIGRHNTLRTIIEVKISRPNGQTLTQTMTESYRSQALRIAEE